MYVTREQIDEYFERFGWTYSHESEDTWITGVRTSVSAFRIMVRLTEHWVFFIINPFVVAPPDGDDRLRVYYHALRYNLDMNFAKLGLDGDGDLFMAIELPTENFDYSHFVDALDGLSHHATMIYAELFGLAHSSDTSVGRYDEELELDDRLADIDEKDMMSFLAALASESEDKTDEPEADDSDDVIIAGKRLRITDGEDGSAKIELEEDLPDDPTEDDESSV